MRGVARPPLHVGTVGEFVVLVAIAQDEFPGLDDTILIEGAGILNGLFGFPEAADHRLCKAIAKPERLAQFFFFVAFSFLECAWVVVDPDDAEHVLVNRPTGGIISGQGSLMQLSGWTVPEMVLDFEVAADRLALGGRHRPRIEQLRDFLTEGRDYAKLKQAAADSKTDAPIQDPRYESLAPYLRGEKRVFIEANSRRRSPAHALRREGETQDRDHRRAADALEAGRRAQEARRAGDRRGGDVAAAGGVRSVRRRLRQRRPAARSGGAVLHSLERLVDRGLRASNSRNVPFEAAQAVAYGLPEAEALKAITLYPARILGVETQMGTLTAGKLANVIVTDGSPLQPTTHYKAIFVGGQPLRPREPPHAALRKVPRPAA